MNFQVYRITKKMGFHEIIKKAGNNPKKLFLVDALGAFLSAFLLGFVLVRLKNYVGIPPAALYFLSAFPVVFAIFDLYCYLKTHKKIGAFLKMIAVLNLQYCVVSLGFAFYHKKTLTGLGWTYISVEILIILLLSAIEFTVGKRLAGINYE